MHCNYVCNNVLPILKCNQRFVANIRTLVSTAHTTSETQSTVDLKEVEHLSTFADNWWNSKGPMHGLHSLNELRVPFIRDGLLCKINTETRDTSAPLKNINILEVGCGGGILSEPLARLGAQITGVDASPELINIARAHLCKQKNILNNISYVADKIEDFSKENTECFDAVVISEVFEHIHEKELFLESCVRTLKQDGSIFITTMNKSLPSWLFGIIFAEDILKIVPSGTHDWNKFITPHETQRLLEINNCYTHKVHGMFYAVWNKRWSWSSNTDINYALHAVKRNKQMEEVKYHDK